MNAKDVEYSKWGMLKSLAITEDMLLSIIANSGVTGGSWFDIEAPTYGVLMELYYFVKGVYKQLNRNQNRLLKLLVDSLFPMCTISRADRLERKIRGMCDFYSSMPAEEQVLYLQTCWRPQATGHFKNESTKEMKKYGLCESELELILKNPCCVLWRLEQPASRKFFTDLRNLLHRKRVPVKEIEMVIRQICSAVEKNPCSVSCTSSDGGHPCMPSDHDHDSICEARYMKSNVKRREKRAQAKIKRLQLLCKSQKSVNERQAKKIHQLSEVMSEYIQFLSERNSEIRKLSRSVQCLEESVEFLECEVASLREEVDQSVSNSQFTVADLTQQIEELQKRYKLLAYSSTRSFNCNVRELCYALLAMRIPPARIKPIIESVLSCLLPSVDLTNLRFPKKSCAANMRSKEMPTLSSVHKGYELSKSKEWHLNSDGTTLHQSKKVAFLINGIVLGVSDINDGSSQAAMDALKNELRKIDSVKEDDIERITSSTSDGASTQSKFNRLLAQQTMKEPGTILENKCAMHLGVNLRHAHVKAMSALTSIHDDNSDSEQEDSDMVSADSEGSSDDETESRSSRRRNDLDVFVHEMCKVFGHLGTPEYCHGASTFKVFLSSKIQSANSDAEELQYYMEANKVHLERQVGSRYYVTSCNAGRIYFLKQAFSEFLCEQQYVKTLNLLESVCLKKLANPLLIMKARLEGLLFDRVYADLMMLVKSKVLNKTALAMTLHYEELLQFLQNCINNPALLLDRESVVFKTAEELYSSDNKLNHRLKKNYQPVHEMLYSGSCSSTLASMISGVCEAMSEKLQTYFADYLPDGRYYDPDIETQSALSQLKPHNDQTESVFGTNDWLDRILPNMAQATKSAMIEFAYNKTLKWLKSQGEEQKQSLIKLAQQRRRIVAEHAKQVTSQRIEKMVAQRTVLIQKGKRKAEKISAAIEALQDETVIATAQMLKERWDSILALSLPEKVKEAEVKYLVKQQVDIRSKVYKQRVRILLTEKGKPKTIDKIFTELSCIIKKHPVEVDKTHKMPLHQQLNIVFKAPSLLVGCNIRHQFEHDKSLLWYQGQIVSYRKQNFKVLYPETDEMCDFTLSELKEDFYSGDLWFI